MDSSVERWTVGRRIVFLQHNRVPERLAILAIAIEKSILRLSDFGFWLAFFQFSQEDFKQTNDAVSWVPATLAAGFLRVQMGER